MIYKKITSSFVFLKYDPHDFPFMKFNSDFAVNNSLIIKEIMYFVFLFYFLFTSLDFRSL